MLSRQAMVEEITARVNKLIADQPKRFPEQPKKGGQFFTCRSIEKERQETVFKAMCPYVGVKL